MATRPALYGRRRGHGTAAARAARSWRRRPQDGAADGGPRPPLRDGRRYAVAAIDAPGWGGRPVPAEYEPFNAEIEELTAAGKPLGDAFARRGVVAARLAIPEWRATIDALTALDWIGADALIGYWGVSLGSAIGVPLVAAEPRIKAAVLGLMGYETLAEPAARITVPVEFVLQWDDEIVPRESGLALFDAIGSAERTLHANPGGHMDVPRFEIDSSERFFARHLMNRGLDQPA